MKLTVALFVSLFFLISAAAQRPDLNSWEKMGNYKLADPVGLGDEHFIENDQNITYTIYFQNNGEDTIYNLRVVDTLSNYLDLSTFRTDGASHPFNMHVLEDNIVRFSFANIRLPNFSTNESGAKGWVKFTVSPRANLPAMTPVTNTAAIYFDFSPVVLTNTVYHTIIDNLTNVHSGHPGTAVAHVFPNPVDEKAVFDLQAASFSSGDLSVFNAAGQLMCTRSFTEQQFELDVADLPAGAYHYIISLNGVPATNGTLQVY